MGESIHKSAKFGGTSMAQPDVVAGIVADSLEIDIVVVSAPGKNEAKGVNIKMTDQLIRLATFSKVRTNDKAAFNALRNEILDRFENIYAEIDNNNLKILRETAKRCLDKINQMPNAMNYAMSLGEQLSAIYFAKLLNKSGVKARYVDPIEWVVFSKAGKLKNSATAKNLAKIVKKASKISNIIVTPGFYGYDSNGDRHLLGRGGSDRTGALAAQALAQIYGDENVVYENWTDQDGIKTTDPRIVGDAIVVDELTYTEVREGANGGSGVLQGDTIRDLLGSKITVVVRNTFNISQHGTTILAEREPDYANPVVAISGKKLRVVTIEDMGMADSAGYVEKILALVSRARLSFEHMPTSHDNLSITFDGDTSEESIIQLVEDIKKYVFRNLGNKNAIVNYFTNDVVYLVGEPLRSSRHSTPIISSAIGLFEDDDYQYFVQHPDTPCVAIFVKEGLGSKYIRIFHEQFVEAA